MTDDDTLRDEIAAIITSTVLPVLAARIRAAEERAEQAESHLADGQALLDRAERAEAAIGRVRVLPRRPWDEDDADSVVACSARAYNSGLADCRRAIGGAPLPPPNRLLAATLDGNPAVPLDGPQSSDR